MYRQRAWAATLQQLVPEGDPASEPVRRDRVTTGLYVLIVISILIALAYALKKNYWKDVH